MREGRVGRGEGRRGEQGRKEIVSVLNVSISTYGIREMRGFNSSWMWAELNVGCGRVDGYDDTAHLGEVRWVLGDLEGDLRTCKPKCGSMSESEAR